MEVAQTGRPVREMKAQLARLPEWFQVRLGRKHFKTVSHWLYPHIIIIIIFLFIYLFIY